MSDLKENSLVTVYKFDDETNVFIGKDFAQVINGKPLLAPYCVDFAPALKDGYYYKIDEEKTTWTEHKFPTTIEECLGIELEHKRNDLWTIKMRSIFENLTKDSTTYRIKSDPDTLNKSIEAIPEKNLEELKTEKLSALETHQRAYEANVCQDMKVMSSLGFLIDADIRSQTNIQSLLDNTQEGLKVNYMCGDNIMRQLTVNDLKIMKNECFKNGQSLYFQLWNYKAAIAAAQTKEELNAINFNFKMMDFSVEA